ncbi:hypothetical protein GNF80_15670 [Clostridium perfringens]|nr:hypothetical protein [Clostridium perfringens]
MRMVKESIKNKETKIRVGGVIYSNVLEDYQDGKFKGEKKTLTETLSNLGFYTERKFVKCIRCGSFISASKNNKKYCRECSCIVNKENVYKGQQARKEIYAERNKEFFKRFDGKFIYYLLDKQDKIRYVGETTNIYIRSKRHLNGHDPVTKDFVKSKDFKNIVFIDLENTELIKNEDELKYLEAYLINTYKIKNLLNNRAEESNYKKFFENNMLERLTDINKELLEIENMIEWV